MTSTKQEAMNWSRYGKRSGTSATSRANGVIYHVVEHRNTYILKAWVRDPENPYRNICHDIAEFVTLQDARVYAGNVRPIPGVTA